MGVTGAASGLNFLNHILGVYLDLWQQRPWKQHVANQALHQHRLRIEHVKRLLLTSVLLVSVVGQQ